MPYVRPRNFVADYSSVQRLRDSDQVCVHGFYGGHTATCPGHPQKCQHGFQSGHTATCPGGQDQDARR